MQVTKAYNAVAQSYAAFYNNDLYSVCEDKAIADFAAQHMKDVLARDRIAVGDFGCGAGIPNVAWLRWFRGRGPGSITYYGSDVSPGMIQAAHETYASHVLDGVATFEVASAAKVLPTFPENRFDLVVSLHGVFSHVDPQDVPTVTRELARVTRGATVLSFLSRRADCRKPEYPRNTMHECRQLGGDLVEIRTFEADEIRSLVEEAGMEVVAMRGFGVRGGMGDVHASFVQRQDEIRRRARQGQDMTKEWKHLASDIEAAVRGDENVGITSPERGHDIVVVTRSQ